MGIDTMVNKSNYQSVIDLFNTIIELENNRRLKRSKNIKETPEAKTIENKKETPEVKLTENKKETPKVKSTKSKKVSPEVKSTESKKKTPEVKGTENKKETPRVKSTKSKKETPEVKSTESKKVTPEVKLSESKKEAPEAKTTENKKETPEVQWTESKKETPEAKTAENKKETPEDKLTESIKETPEDKLTESKKETPEDKLTESKKETPEDKLTERKKETLEVKSTESKKETPDVKSANLKKGYRKVKSFNRKKGARKVKSFNLKKDSRKVKSFKCKKVTSKVWTPNRKVFVFKGYGTDAAAYMSYHLGLICHKKFGSPLFIVEHKNKLNNLPEMIHPNFDYPLEYPAITIGEMKRIMEPNDLFICNSAYSTKWFGLNLPMKKLMYIQGMNTYPVLDIFYDNYVSVSSFVQQHVKHVFNTKSPVISPFINHSIFKSKTEWKDRNNVILVLRYKGYAEPNLNYLQTYYTNKYPSSSLEIKMVDYVKQKELADLYNQNKYFLTLNPSEGFGLPPLEAMASGCAVIGFDSMGGREYFEHEKNAYIVDYGDFDRLAEYLRKIELNPNLGEEMAKQAIQTAQLFTYSRFEEEWTNYLMEHVYNT